MLSKVRFEIVSGLYCEFVTWLVDNDILISSIDITEFGIKADCHATDYIRIARMAKKFQCRTRIIEKKGIYFKLRKILKRKGLVIGTAMVFLYLFLFSQIIWRIDIISSDANIESDVSSLLYTNNIYSGSIFSREKNNRAIQQIFTDVDNVGYVTMNFTKGILTCKIDPAINKLPYLENSTNGNIIASESGVIEQLRVYKGFSKVSLGQSVLKGDMLVSATYIDRNGTLQQVMPRAFVKAFCEKEYTAQIDFEKDISVRNGEYEQQVVLKFLGKNLTLKRPDLEEMGKYDTEKTMENVSLIGFSIPMTMEKTKYYNKETVHITRDENTAYYAGIKVIEAMLKSDKALLECKDKCFTYTTDDKSLTITCTVHGYYDITK